MYKQTIKRCFSYLSNYRLEFFLSVLMAFIYVIASLYIPLLAGRAIDSLIGPGSVDFVSLSADAVRIFITAIVCFVSQYVLSRLNNRMTYRIARDVRNDAFRKIEVLPFSYLDSNRQGDIVSRIINDVEQLSDGLLLGFSQFFSASLTIVVTIYYLFSLDFIIALVVILVSPLSFLVAKFIASRTHRFFKSTAQMRSLQTDLTDEFITSSPEVICYNLQSACQDKFNRVNEQWADSSLKGTFYSSLVNPATRAVNSIVYACAALCGSFLVLAGRLTVGGLVSALSYANQYTKPFNEITGVVTELQNALVCASRVFALLDEKEIVDEGKEELPEGALSVEFRNVCFSYTPGQNLIRNFSLKIGKGQHVAIVGPTGAGKSTIINLLMRYYEIDEGNILIDGISIKDIKLSSLRRSFGSVLQDSFIKSASVKDNITMGRDFSDEEVIEACKKAHVHNMIMRLEDGYDTVLDDDEGLLSAGERQLIAIARCMIDLPDLLILDEATSNIDTRTEGLIQDSFNRMMEGRTSFVVAHRLSTIRNADVILVMKDGNIVEAGNHDELLKKNGFYSELYRSQFASVS